MKLKLLYLFVVMAATSCANKSERPISQVYMDFDDIELIRYKEGGLKHIDNLLESGAKLGRWGLLYGENIYHKFDEDTERTIAKLQEQLTREPENYRICASIGKMYIRLGEYDMI